MSVLIKGMEMPASCLSCPHHEHGTIHEWELYCGFTGDYIGHWDDKSLNNGHRPDTCPLVEVPTPHGSLKDTDELKDWIEAWFTMHRSYHPYSRSNLIPTTEIVDIIDRLPTIIEAEEGEDDE